MKIRYMISLFVFVLVFVFGLISCSDSNNEAKIFELENELVDKNLEIENLKEELRVTKIDLEAVQKELDKKIEEEKEQLAEENEEQEELKIQEYRIGDTILFSDANTKEEICSVIVHSIENFTDFGRYAPDEGMRYVILDIEVENCSNEVQSYNALNYSLRDANYYRYDNVKFRKEPAFSSGDLAPMDIMRGWITIELPEDVVVTEILVGPCYCEPPAIIKVVPSLE